MKELNSFICFLFHKQTTAKRIDFHTIYLIILEINKYFLSTFASYYGTISSIGLWN